MKITHLCIYVPPVLGAYLLHHHSPKPPTLAVPTPTQVSQGETTVVRLSKQAHFLLPPVIEQQAERLRTARQAAAHGMLSSYTVPLLADTQTLHNKGKINWSLKFLLPLPQNVPPTVDSPLCHSRLDGVVNRPSKALCTRPLPSTIPIPPVLTSLILPSCASGPYYAIWRRSPSTTRL